MVEWMDWLVPVIAIAGVVLFCVGCYFIADWRMRKRLLVCDATILEKDLAGKRYVVTGGSSGLGFHTVIQLVKQGGTCCRWVQAHRRFARGEAEDRN